MITGEATREELAKCYGGGTRSLMNKPFTPDRVVSFVQGNLDAAKRQRRTAEQEAEAERKLKAMDWKKKLVWTIKSHARARKGTPERKRFVLVVLCLGAVVAGIVMAAMWTVMQDEADDAIRDATEQMRRDQILMMEWEEKFLKARSTRSKRSSLSSSTASWP